MSEVLQTVTAPAPERTVEVVALEIRTLQRQAQGVILSYAIEIGRRLEEAKEMLPHGEWGAWLKRELDYSQSTAQNFMKVFREYGASQQSLFGGEAKSQALGNLTYTKALRLLAIPDEEERERFVEEHDVDSMSTRELEQAIRERDEALKRESDAESAKAEAEAEQARLKEELAKAEKKVSAAQTCSQSATERVAALSRELEELRSRPVDVAVETVIDQEAVAKAKAEAKAELEAKLERAKAEKEKALEKQKTAEDALSAANAKMEELKAAQAQAIQAAQAEGEEVVKELQKRLAAADPDTAAFKLLYETWQTDYDKMAQILGRIAQADPEKGEKLRGAVKAALERMGESGGCSGGATTG